MEAKLAHWKVADKKLYSAAWLMLGRALRSHKAAQHSAVLILQPSCFATERTAKDTSLYSVLGVSEKASTKEIKTAFRQVNFTEVCSAGDGSFCLCFA